MGVNVSFVPLKGRYILPQNSIARGCPVTGGPHAQQEDGSSRRWRVKKLQHQEDGTSRRWSIKKMVHQEDGGSGRWRIKKMGHQKDACPQKNY